MIKQSRGDDMARRLYRGRKAMQQTTGIVGCEPVEIQGLKKDGAMTSLPKCVLAALLGAILKIGRIYQYSHTIILDIAGDDPCIVELFAEGKVTPVGAAYLALTAVGITMKKNDETDRVEVDQRFPVHEKVWAQLFVSSAMHEIQKVSIYLKQPAYDMDFNLVRPGWNGSSAILCHAPEIDVAQLQRVDGVVQTPHIETLLSGFCFRDPADRENTIAILVTTILVMHFIPAGKPIIILDGNQPGVGKTLLARIIGIIADGRDPQLLHYSQNDEELAKRICALLRNDSQRLLIFDNAKVVGAGRVESTVIEANSVSPKITLRILGKSQNIERNNDLIWMLTMNATKISPDLVSRSLPIRLNYDGDPRKRHFHGADPVEYAQKYRLQILGEVAGMVTVWNHAGRPKGAKTHRLAHWAEIIGGVMEACGFTEFMTNLDEADADFDLGRDDLSALAEKAIAQGHPFAIPQTDENAEAGAAAGEWQSLFNAVGIESERLTPQASKRSVSTLVGNWLNRNLDRDVPIEIEGEATRACLRMREGRSRRKEYYFEYTPIPDVVEKPQQAPNVLSFPERQSSDANQPRSDKTPNQQGEGSNSEAW